MLLVEGRTCCSIFCHQGSNEVVTNHAGIVRFLFTWIHVHMILCVSLVCVCVYVCACVCGVHGVCVCVCMRTCVRVIVMHSIKTITNK